MEKISFRHFFLVYYASLVISVILQTILKFTAMDPATGFYNPGNVLPVVLGIIITASILFWFVMTLFRRTKHDYPVNYKHRLTSIFSILCGISIFYYTISDIKEQVYNQASSLTWNKIMLLLSFCMGIAAALSMIVGGIGAKYFREGKPGAILGIFPCLWQLVVLLSRFNNFIAITTLSDVLMNLLFMCAASIFFLGQSRIIYGLGIRNGRTYAVPSGLSLSLLGLTLIIPNLIYRLVYGHTMFGVTIPLSEYIYIAALSIYSIVFLSGFSKSIKKV